MHGFSEEALDVLANIPDSAGALLLERLPGLWNRRPSKNDQVSAAEIRTTTEFERNAIAYMRQSLRPIRRNGLPRCAPPRRHDPLAGHLHYGRHSHDVAR
jgi:hypothetical protein